MAARLRRVDARVVGVGEEVEHQLEALTAARLEHVLLLAAGGERQRRDGAEQREQQGLLMRGLSFRFQGVARRSASVTSANSATAIRVRITMPA